MSKLNVEIVTPTKKVFSGQSYMVSVPGVNGSMGFLPGHVGFVTPLGKGKITLSETDNVSDKYTNVFDIEGGYVQIFDDNVEILVEHITELQT